MVTAYWEELVLEQVLEQVLVQVLEGRVEACA